VSEGITEKKYTHTRARSHVAIITLILAEQASSNDYFEGEYRCPLFFISFFLSLSVSFLFYVIQHLPMKANILFPSLLLFLLNYCWLYIFLGIKQHVLAFLFSQMINFI